MSIDINRMIDECIEQLADDRVETGVEGLYELATAFKSAGIPRQSFVEICEYIENEAAELADSEFVRLKINMALKKIREKKKGIILVH